MYFINVKFNRIASSTCSRLTARNRILSYLSLLADFSFFEVYFGYFILGLLVHSLYAVYKQFEHYF